MKKITASALFILVMAFSSLAFAQTTTSGSFFSRMPMFAFWGSQTTVTVPATQTTATTQSGQANANTSLQDFWSLMPMFQFLNLSQ